MRSLPHNDLKHTSLDKPKLQIETNNVAVKKVKYINTKR